MPRLSSQFSLQSLLCSMLTVSMLLAYVRMFGEAVLRPAIIGLVFALSWGALVGAVSRRVQQSLTWALVGYAMALCCVLSADRLGMPQFYYWLWLGSMAGGLAGGLPVEEIRNRLVFTAILSAVFVPVGFLVASGERFPIDPLIAPAVILGLLMLTEIVERDQRHHTIALDVWAAGIVFAVIVGNFMAVAVWNYWYV